MSLPAADTAARIAARIAAEIGARPAQVAAAAALLDGGATVPFVARYRKEATGGLDDTQLRSLAERLAYLRELEARRAAILDTVAGQGKLTDALAGQIAAATTKAELEDLYLPYRPKRRTRAMIAREHGLAPLAEAIRADRAADPAALAAGFLTAEVPDTKAALAGARDIVTEELAEDAALLQSLRALMRAEAQLSASVIAGQEAPGAKFSDYFAHAEPWQTVPSHRALAMFRGRNEGFLDLALEVAPEGPLALIHRALGVAGRAPGDLWLTEAGGWAWRVKLRPGLTVDLLGELRERAEAAAIGVFARNLRDLLLAAPAGGRATLGLDPGIRTGVKCAVVDATGKVLETATVHPFAPRHDTAGAQAVLAALIVRHKVALVAIGNGTASRETDALVAELLARLPAPRPVKAVVSEAGASVYSASALASAELPGLDVSLRGAVSIARRLQDPLAELVKIEPKSIGVGQYQHDVDQARLGRSLDGVVEDAVNAVGVEVNTASAPLLARVAGIGPGLAEAIVAHRDAGGPFRTRRDLLKVPRLGPKAFEQCAGFLRIRDGAEPLDASAVHPEAYGVARRIVAACGTSLAGLMASPERLRGLDARDFVDGAFGLPTVRDILAELEKPGRDPRPEFRTARFAEGVTTLADLRPGMQLEGTVTNVAAFGAFVDVGVHQDGLVHISQLADRFVKDPHAVVKAGDVVTVRVLEVDHARKRIALTMRRTAAGSGQPTPNGAPAGRPGTGEDKVARAKAQAAGARPARQPQRTRPGEAGEGSLGAALRDAMERGRKT